MTHNGDAGVFPGLTPDSLRTLLNQLVTDRPAGARDHVEVSAVMERLLGGMPLPGGAAGWQARTRLQRAIAATAAETPGVKYVEGDA